MNVSYRKYIFINLSNGVEAIDKNSLDIERVRFLRIQSTACEQKRYEDIINDLSPDFLLLASLGKSICVYDYGARKKIPRAIWQGLEWVKYVLNRRWLGKEYPPIGKASSMQGYFEQQYSCLSKRTKTMLDYYGKYSVGNISIFSETDSTGNDGNTEYFVRVLRAA